MNITKQLSDSLLAACRMANITEPKYIAQDGDDSVWHYPITPDTNDTLKEKIFAYNALSCMEEAIRLNHPPYASDWQDSLLEWVDHIADTSKKVDDACKIAYRKHIDNGNGTCWSRADCYRAAWLDALAWKGGDDD